MSSIRVRCFGRLAEEAEPDFTVAVPAEGLTLGALRLRLARELGAPSLLDRHVRGAIGDEMAQDDRRVFAGDEVDFLAPLSGG
jgi:molybdopterin converting factor small subunit